VLGDERNRAVARTGGHSGQCTYICARSEQRQRLEAASEGGIRSNGHLREISAGSQGRGWRRIVNPTATVLVAVKFGALTRHAVGASCQPGFTVGASHGGLLDFASVELQSNQQTIASSLSTTTSVVSQLTATLAQMDAPGT